MKSEINWLIKLIKNFLRILCVFIFLRWFSSSYANCSSYYEIINKVESHKEKVEYGKDNQQTIAEIEDKILKEIEVKKKTSGLKREWKDKWISVLEGESNSSEEEKKKYNEKLEKAKEETIKNIQNQLRENDLDITELDDQRTSLEKIWYDPLKFFFISPLNRVNKLLSNSLNLQELFLLEIVFKLLVIKLFFMFFVNYSEEETSAFSRGWEKMQDPSLSMEEKEKIQQEISPLVWRGVFNFLTIPLTFFLILHPCFVDRSSFQYLATSSWSKWALPMIGVSFISSISSEFLRQGKILGFKEIKAYLTQNWLVITVMGLIFNIALPFFVPALRNTYGFQLIILCSGLIDVVVNTIKAGIIQRRKKDH